MNTQLKVLGWLHIVIDALFMLVVITYGVFLAIMSHSFAMEQAVPSNSQGPEMADISNHISNAFSGTGMFLLATGIVVGISGIIAGWAMLRRPSWGRVLGIIVSVMDIFLFNPLHIALGIYGLVILLNQETGLLFKRA